MHPTTPCAVVYKFFTGFFYSFLQFFTFFTVFYIFYSFVHFLQFFTFFTVFYKAVEWAGDFGAGDIGGL